MPDREILVDSKIMVVAIMVVAIIAVNGRTRSNIRPICQVEFENLVTTMVVVNPDNIPNPKTSFNRSCTLGKFIAAHFRW